MRKKEDRLEKEMADLQLQNRRLTEPLQKAREEVAELQRQLANYEKDKTSLAVSASSFIVESTFILTFIRMLKVNSIYFGGVLATRYLVLLAIMLGIYSALPEQRAR